MTSSPASKGKEGGRRREREEKQEDEEDMNKFQNTEVISLIINSVSVRSFKGPIRTTTMRILNEY